jgi:hypothetical protein
MKNNKRAKNNRGEWIEKLYSGEYTQAKNYLRASKYNEEGEIVPSGYCCLGVACTKHSEDPENSPWSCDNTTLGKKGLEALGLTDYEQGALAEANDNHDMTFEEIGMWLEFSELAECDLEIETQLDEDDEEEE